VFTLGNAEKIGASPVFNFTLTPGSAEALAGEVKITGNLEASPVPLPASFWLLFAGLSAIISSGKRSRRRV
jgi:hypothetical protein